MAERPILFNAAMVRALLAGAKTQTRRVVKLRNGQYMPPSQRADSNGWAQMLRPCPYGQPGDRLWVRETWYCDDYRVQRGPYLKPADMDIDEARKDGTLIYRASSGDRPYEAEQPVWRPAIHMPRWASRITLQVTGVRVERLQDISESDAETEGAEYGFDCEGGFTLHPLGNRRHGYAHLWEQINGAGSWGLNPWVWVVAFKRLETAA